ncbi:MAG TPA: tetratricopeptide repeat protein [Pyrinomonadaceae bacterium]|nr:tetratricopeptide repeat protein [Pyrinomonadaceae bacterium]
MTLRASLLRELLDPTLGVGGRAKLGCELSREFENRGEYEEAREVLSGLWPRVGERPKLEGLERSTAAELLLRVGVLTGIIGSSHVTNAQEKAKDLISESLTLFQSLRDKTKLAEARIELALCYWRTGEYNEALDLLKDALALLITDSELKGKALIRWAIVELNSGRHSEALKVLTENAALFQKVNNQMVKGCYHQAIGDVLVYLWKSKAPGDYLDRALVEYAAASYHFEQAEHRRYRANIENNLGFLYYKINYCKEAHGHLDRARRIFTSLKDKSSVAEVDETRARVFLKEQRNAEAEKAARSSVRILEKSEMQSKLAEALTTHGTALARIGNYGTALSAFRRAIDLSQQTGSLNRASETALTVFQEMGDRLAVVTRGNRITGRKLIEEIRSLEHDLIKYSLETAKGSVTRAARALGVSYQELNYMLQTRHKDLLSLRTPVRRRPRQK